ncbi:EamA family transporter [Agromyces sp. M3QZ16-3]|uniref:EamA family transporter n=1 Tax=Agromyces sp. M3QZ16-3 TaxID=3447585 RepID=UPI003F68BFF6
MLTAVLSLSGAIVYGAADFLGGLAARRLGALLATAVASVAGLVTMIAALPVLGGAWALADLGWGALSGVIGAVAIALLYACLAIGPMSILSPLTALMSAITPMLWGTLVGAERFGPLGVWGIGIALVAVVLVGFVPERGAVRPSARGLLLAVGSGLAIGAYYIAISHTTDASGVVPLIANRVVSATVLFSAFGALAVFAALRARSSVPAAAPAREKTTVRTAFALALACGVVDATANVLLLLGIRAGDLAVAAVLGAMYPAGTILLAAIVLRERIAPVQWAGLALALAAAGMLALA